MTGTEGNQDTTPNPSNGQGGSGDASPEAKAFKQAYHDERSKRQALEREVAGLKSSFQQQIDALKNPPKPEPTRAELEREVQEGRMSASERDRILEEQTNRHIEQTAAKVADQRITDQQRAAKVAADIDRYAAAIPEVMNDGSDERNRVAARYNHLVNEKGFPANEVTQSVALEMVFGPVESLVPRGEARRETLQEGGSGAGGGPDDRGSDSEGIPKGLTARQKDYYSRLVGPGKLYKDWAAVQDELKDYRGRGRRERVA